MYSHGIDGRLEGAADLESRHAQIGERIDQQADLAGG